MLKSQQPTVRAQQQEQSGTVVDYVESKHKLLPAKSNPNQTVGVADVVEPSIHPTNVPLEMQCVGNV